MALHFLLNALLMYAVQEEGQFGLSIEVCYNKPYVQSKKKTICLLKGHCS